MQIQLVSSLEVSDAAHKVELWLSLADTFLSGMFCAESPCHSSRRRSGDATF